MQVYKEYIEIKYELFPMKGSMFTRNDMYWSVNGGKWLAVGR